MSSNSLWVSIAVLVTAAVGCGGGGEGGGPGPSSGTCSETALFPPAAYGENGDDLIRAIQIDPANGDLYYSTYTEVFRLPAGTRSPEKVMDRPEPSTGGELWLVDGNRTLFPSGLQVPIVQEEAGVLFATNRDGSGAPVVQVPVPPPPSLDWTYQVFEVVVGGDDVFWTARDWFMDGRNDEQTFYLRRTSWRTPGAPKELYRSSRLLQSPIVAGRKLLFDEQTGPTGDIAYEQRSLDLDSGVVDGNAATTYVGTVMAGDDTVLLVQNFDFADAARFGVWRTAPDGSGRQMVLPGAYANYQGGQRNGTFVFTDLSKPETQPVYAFSDSAGARKIGCIDSAGTTTHAAAVGADAAYVSIYRDSKATILRFPL